jgi:hypothetical protein
MGTRKALLVAGLALLLGAASSAQAMTIVLGSCFTGDCGVLPPDYQVRLTLTDVTHDFGDGAVSALQIVVSPTTSSGVGDLGSVFLSFGSAVAPAPWAVTDSTGWAGTDPKRMLVRFPARGGTRAGFGYDVELDFHPPGGKGSKFLAPGGSLTFTIAGLSAGAFDGGIAHIQRIGPSQDGGAHVRVSAPIAAVPDALWSVTAFGMGLVALLLARRRISQ